MIDLFIEYVVAMGKFALFMAILCSVIGGANLIYSAFVYLDYWLKDRANNRPL